MDTIAAAPVGTCPLFGRCGGCSLLDRPDADYAAGKHAAVVSALAGAGLAVPVAPLARTPFASRRRATFSVGSGPTGLSVGYQAARSHEIVDVRACPALDPELGRALPAIRRIAAAAGHGARLTATLVANGIDVAVARPRQRRPARSRPPADMDAAIVRLTDDGDIVFLREAPVVLFDGVAVPFPPAAFLQASRAGEAHLVALVTAAAAGAGAVLDAFAGLGTFTFPLARGAKVTAAEVDGPAMEALRHAAAHAAGRRPVLALRRNLMRDPLSARELVPFDAAVFDPPRTGAEALAHALAGSTVPTLVAVSCAPRTLARDCAILVAGGYKITQVVPVDQFVGTRHIEAVATLERTP